MPSQMSKNRIRRRALTVVLLALLAVLLLNLPTRQAAPVPPPIASPSIQPSPATPIAPVADASAPKSSPEKPALAKDAAFSQFNQWTERFLAADVAQRAALLNEGKALAETRSAALKDLIRADPESAWTNAISPETRAQLPAVIQGRLEKRVSGRGSIMTAVGTDFSGDQLVSQKSKAVEIDGTYYEAHLYGRRARQTTVRNTSLHGLTIDNVMAVHADTARLLDPSEYTPEILAAAQGARCPVSGKLISAQSLAVASVGGRAIYLCHGGHIQEITDQENAAEDAQVAQEGGNGGAQKPGTVTSTGINDGPKTLLYMRLIFPDSQSDPQSEADCYQMLKDMNDFWVGNSHGRCYIIPTVSAPIMMPRTSAWYAAKDDNSAMTLRSDALEAARKAGYDYTAYDLEAIRYNGASGGFGGQAYVGSRGCWLKSSSVGVAAHEFGHNMGLWHANLWKTNPDDSVIGPGSSSEYGNSFDTMGNAAAGNNYFNSEHQNELNWLPNEFVATANKSGMYRIYQLDQPVLKNGQFYALKVNKDNERDYWAEFRQRFTGNNWISNGVLLEWSPWTQAVYGAHLLDTTPGTPNGTTDAALIWGRTFSDYEAGVHITPIGKGGTTPESLDVVVNIGAFAGNSAPDISNLIASSTTPATGTNVTFTATATDPDGDPLAYYWDFGDGQLGSNSTNTNTPTISFAVAGSYNVVCTVSDMKGHTTRRAILISVGTITNFRIAGQVSSSGVPIAGALVKTNTNLTGYTDSNGNYSIGGVATGSYTVSASADGFSFSTLPVTVGPSKLDANFDATPIALVSLSTPDSDIGEAGQNPGTIRFTRTGSTAAALTVRFMLFKDLYPFTTATITNDADFFSVSPVPGTVTLNPNYYYTVNQYTYTLTIPAGSATLDWVITPKDDTTAEGTKVFSVELFADSGYRVGSPSTATLEIQDNDSTKGKVYITAEDSFGSEVGPKTASFRVTRIGSTAASLTVNFTTSGSATSGADYVSLGSSITFNPGESSKLLVVTPIDDALTEGTESVTVSLTSIPAAYDLIFNNQLYTATVYILDDDIPTLTLATPTPTAFEVGQVPGVFVVTRTGSTANALNLNYSITGSALNGTDYYNLPGTVTIPAGSDSAAITIVPYNDSIGEPDQTVVISLESDVKYQLGTPNSGTVTIKDDGDPPHVSVNATISEAKEGSATGKFTIYRPKTGATTTVNYSVSGTATPGSDYTVLSGSVTFGINETTKDIVITPVDDAVAENNETVVLTLTSDPAYVINPNEATATVNIHDNETTEVTAVASNLTLSETSAAVPFYLFRSSSTGTLTVNFTLTGTAINGTDYTTVPLSATFAAGQSSVTVNITPIDDAIVEGTESVILTLTDNPGVYSIGPAPSATMYITDSETPTLTVQFAASSSNGFESAATVNIPVTLSASPSSPVTVEYVPYGGSAYIGLDYAFAPGLLTFNTGETSKNITFTVNEDSQIESDETVIVRLLNPNGAKLGTSQHTYTIKNNDAYDLPRIGFAAAASSVSETAGTAQIQLSLSSALAASATVDYAVSGGMATGGGVDYTLAAGTVTFAAGETLKTINVAIVDDAIGESTETILVALSNPSSNAQLGGNITHTLSINDDDIPNTLPTISNVTDKVTNEDTSTGAIGFTVNDAETPAASLVVTATSSNTALVPNANITLGGSGTSRTVNIAPAPNQNGTTTITLKVTDSQAGSAIDTFVLTVNPVNDAPTISNITDKGIPPDSVSGPNAFTIGDLETAAGSLTVSGTSTNTTLLPNTNIVFGGSGASRTVALTPAAGRTGTTTVTITVSDGALTATDTFVLNVDPSFAPPTVATAASATPSPVTTKTTQLSVLGTDNSGEANLTYTWATTGTPPAPVTFSRNGTNAAKNAQATFSAPGNYNFTVTIMDAGGLTITSSVSVSVISTLATISLSPSTVEILTYATQSFSATGADQFGQPISTGTLTWSVSAGGGNIDTNGLLKSGGVPGSYSVSATSGAASGSAGVTLDLAPGPQLGSGVTVFPNPAVASMNVAFAVTAQGAAPFTYAWDFGDGAVATAATNIHVYAVAGVYAASVLVTDANGASATATATVTVTDVGSGALPSEPDSDGDGVSDVNEIGAGSNPNDPTSFVMSPLTISKLKLGLSFAKPGKDSIQFSGTFTDLPTGFSPQGRTFAINAGGATSTVTLDSKGRGKSATAAVSLKLKLVKNKATKKSAFAGGSVPFTGAVKLGNWANDWADDGLTGTADAKKAPLSIPFTIAFNGHLYGTTVSGVYSAKAGKTGKFQK